MKPWARALLFDMAGFAVILAGALGVFLFLRWLL